MAVIEFNELEQPEQARVGDFVLVNMVDFNQEVHGSRLAQIQRVGKHQLFAMVFIDCQGVTTFGEMYSSLEMIQERIEFNPTLKLIPNDGRLTISITQTKIV